MMPAPPVYATELAPLQLEQPTRTLWVAVIETIVDDVRTACAPLGCTTCDRADAIDAATDPELVNISEVLGLRTLLLFAARQQLCCGRHRPEIVAAPQRRAA